jgi:cell division protein FtsW
LDLPFYCYRRINPWHGQRREWSKRWIPLSVYEPAFRVNEICCSDLAASYTMQHQSISIPCKGMLPMGIAVALVGGLLMAEPDMGAFVVVALIAFGILFWVVSTLRYSLV